MNSWKLAGWSGVCGLGVLSFLRIVAQEVDRTERALGAREAWARKKYERERRESADQGEPPVMHGVGVGSGPGGFAVRNGRGAR